MTLVKTAETNEGIQDKLTEEERKKLHVLEVEVYVEVKEED